MKNNIVAVFDLETDNIDPMLAHILEVGIALIDLSEGAIVDTWESLVKFNTAIPPHISAINHIILDDLVNGEVLSKVMLKFSDFVGSKILVAHNAEYDTKVVGSIFGFKYDHTLCTMRLAQHLLPEIGSYSLQFLRYFIGIDVDGTRAERAMAHTALSDALLTAKLLNYLWHKFNIKGDKTLLDLERLCWSTIEVPLCPFKKYKGEKWEKVPADYICWCLDNLKDLNDDLKRTMKKYAGRK